jgi:hypothetical protein
MLFDLEAAQGVWFSFFGSHIDPATNEVVWEEPGSDARVQIRPMGPFVEEQMAKRKRVAEFVRNPVSRAMERATYLADLTPEQTKIERDNLIDYAIIAWENFKDSRTGEVIECTRENKLKLIQLPVFDRFVGRCWQLLADSAGLVKENEEKNSSTG